MKVTSTFSQLDYKYLKAKFIKASVDLLDTYLVIRVSCYETDDIQMTFSR